MPIPMPAKYYTTDLESLMSELTPQQRRMLADWVILLAHYSRELIVRATVGTTLSERLLSKANLKDDKDEHGNIENVLSALKGTEQNLEHLTTMVNALQAVVADSSFLGRTLYNHRND
jgi:hypothetical protein